jgi:hypothetical protein
MRKFVLYTSDPEAATSKAEKTAEGNYEPPTVGLLR